MTPHETEFQRELSRRKLLAAAGIGSGVGMAAPFLGTAAAQEPGPQPISGAATDPVRTPPVTGLHLQFGGDASSDIVVSWHALQAVRSPRVMIGRLDGRLERVVDARETSYTDAKSGQSVFAYHAKIDHLEPDSSYLYGAIHEGAEPEFGSFRTAPRGRARFTFTSFGDQGTPTLGRRATAPAGSAPLSSPYVNDNLGSPWAADTTLGVERLRPLFHLFNGDLCYANLAEDRVRTWWDFWTNNSRSARNRPWMPSAGNHENELGNGPIGYQAYQTYFAVPEAGGQTEVTRGLWYAFTVGGMRVISIANDDVAYQDAGSSYVRGYSAGAQKAWLEAELSAARANRGIDWIVVCMHQVAISTANMFNGADLGIRQEWVPLFDRYGVDLVVCGHEHHYERSPPHSRPGRQRHPDADPGGDGDRHDRHHSGNRPHGDRRRRHLGTVQHDVLRPAAVPGDHRRRRAASGRRQASSRLRNGASTVVGGPQRGPCLWFRRLRGRRGRRAGRLHHHHRHVLRCGRRRRPDCALRDLYPAPPPPRRSVRLLGRSARAASATWGSSGLSDRD